MAEFISIAAFGAVGDGKTDNTVAIQKAFDYAATNHVAVYIPTGTFMHTGVLKANGIDVFGDGQNSVLYATGAKQMLQLSGDGGSIRNLTLDSNATERSPGTAEEAKLHVYQATNFEISGVLINNSMSVGILVRSSSGGWIHDNTVTSTGSDGMRMTRGSHDIRIEHNTVSHTGDDAIAVISTAGQTITKNIEIVDNRVYDNEWGRGISVVGGESVKIVNNLVDGNLAGRAGVYIASESDYNTQGVNHILVQGNTILDTGSKTVHGSVMVYNGTGLPMKDIDIVDNKIVPPADTSAIKIKGTADVLQHDNGPAVTPVPYPISDWTGTATDPIPTTPTPTDPAPTDPVPTDPVPTTPFSGTVSATGETGKVSGSGDTADDPAIWVNSADPSKSLIVGTSKDPSNGGLFVWDLSGKQVGVYNAKANYNNVDNLNDLLVATNRKNDTADFFKLSPTGQLTKIGSIATGLASPYGVTIGQFNGKTYVFASERDVGLVRQWEVTVNGSTVTMTKVRDIHVAGTVEGMEIDDVRGTVYLSEERVGLHKYSLDPKTGETHTTIAKVGTNGLKADSEGVTIYDTGNGNGYVILSSQGSDNFKVFDRASDKYLGTFSVSGVTDTDGLAATSANLGGAFGKGMLVVHDSASQYATSNFKMVAWDAIQKLIGAVTPPSSPEPTNPTPSDPIPTPTDPAPVAGQEITVGAGSDTMVVKFTQDYYLGDAKFKVFVDGKQIGTEFTAKALHGSGVQDTLTLKGDWGVGAHTVTFQLTNDKWDGTPDKDRNLYVEKISYDGVDLANSAIYVNSSTAKSMLFNDATPVPSSTPTPAPTDGVKLTKVTQQVVSTQDGQVIENLDIWADSGDALVIRHNNVTIKNLRVHHKTGDGISIEGVQGVKILNVEVINEDQPVGIRAETSENIRNIVADGAANLTVDHVTVRGGSTGIYLHQSPGAKLTNIDGYNFFGPMPRGQFVAFDKSPDGSLDRFYAYNDPKHSWVEDNVAVYNSPRVTIKNGVIDGNNSVSGVGVMFEGSSQGGRVENVDVVHQGNGAFSSYSNDVTFFDVRSFDSFNSDQGRGLPSSNGLQFNHSGSGVTFDDTTYTNPGNPGNIVWGSQPAKLLDIHEDKAATPMAHLTNEWHWIF